MRCLFIFVALFSIHTLFAQDWQEDYTMALSKSSNENKPLIVVFSGSDWCAPCKRLDKSIWQSETFRNYALEHYIMYKADFPRKKKNQPSEAKLNDNKTLAEKYNTKGHFPLVVILDSDENVLGKTGYKKETPDNYISLINSFLK